MKWFAIFACLLTAPCYADIINNKPLIGGFGIATAFYNGPFAQTFTATPSEAQIIAASFLWGGNVNPGHQDPAFIVEVRAGAGLLGQRLGSEAVDDVPLNTPAFTWIDFDFTVPIALTPGDTYTLLFEEAVTGGSGVGSFVETGDTYSGGTLMFNKPGPIIPNNPGQAIPSNDLAFRIFGVPEPTTATLLLLGMLGCGWWRRRNS